MRLEQKELPPSFLDGNPGCLICTLRDTAILERTFLDWGTLANQAIVSSKGVIISLAF